MTACRSFPQLLVLDLSEWVREHVWKVPCIRKTKYKRKHGLKMISIPLLSTVWIFSRIVLGWNVILEYCWVLLVDKSWLFYVTGSLTCLSICLVLVKVFSFSHSLVYIFVTECLGKMVMQHTKTWLNSERAFL